MIDLNQNDTTRTSIISRWHCKTLCIFFCTEGKISYPHGSASFFCPSIFPKVQRNEVLGLFTDLSSSYCQVTLSLYYCLKIFAVSLTKLIKLSHIYFHHHVQLDIRSAQLSYDLVLRRYVCLPCPDWWVFWALCDAF